MLAIVEAAKTAAATTTTITTTAPITTTTQEDSSRYSPSLLMPAASFSPVAPAAGNSNTFSNPQRHSSSYRLWKGNLASHLLDAVQHVPAEAIHRCSSAHCRPNRPHRWLDTEKRFLSELVRMSPEQHFSWRQVALAHSHLCEVERTATACRVQFSRSESSPRASLHHNTARVDPHLSAPRQLNNTLTDCELAAISASVALPSAKEPSASHVQQTHIHTGAALPPPPMVLAQQHHHHHRHHQKQQQQQQQQQQQYGSGHFAAPSTQRQSPTLPSTLVPTWWWRDSEPASTQQRDLHSVVAGPAPVAFKMSDAGRGKTHLPSAHSLLALSRRAYSAHLCPPGCTCRFCHSFTSLHSVAQGVHAPLGRHECEQHTRLPSIRALLASQ
jgi:hypothetical protein